VKHWIGWWLNQFEREKLVPSISDLCHIASALNMSVSSLF
jgi:transcriptional regulator with XRE-family HTH domain